MGGRRSSWGGYRRRRNGMGRRPGASERGRGRNFEVSVPQLHSKLDPTRHERRLRVRTIGVEHGWADVRLDAVLVFAILAVFARVVAQYDTALRSSHGRRVRIPADRVGALEAKFA